MILATDGLSLTPPTLRHPEVDLLSRTRGACVAWCGRGATALYLAYRIARALGPPAEQPEVLLPAISCATPANVALLAGLKPRFADVDPETGLLSLDSLRARKTEQTRAVVFIHLFGQTADLTSLAAWCRTNRLFLIEDNAHALGGRLPDGLPVGSAGDFAIYSFNRTKILECGGGALLCREGWAADALEREVQTNPLPPEPDPETTTQLAASYRNLHHGLVSLLRLRPALQVADLFLPVRHEYDSLYLRPLRNPSALAQAWESLPQILQHRRQNAEQYAAILAGGPWHLLEGWRASGVCWRFSFLLDVADRVLAVSEAVRQDSFHVSNLYWPLHHFFNPGDTCPHAVHFARRILNLWVDTTVHASQVEQCARSLWRHTIRFVEHESRSTGVTHGQPL